LGLAAGCSLAVACGGGSGGSPAGSVIGCLTIIELLAPMIATHDPSKADGRQALQRPSRARFFGTDKFGRDVFSRLVYGTRTSLVVGAMAVACAGAVGIPLGLASGYFGGVIDTMLMRLADSFLAFPGLVLALTLVLVFEPSVLTITIALGLGAWPRYARLVRGQVLSLKGQECVLAARSLGAGHTQIILRHIWPNATAPVIVAASLNLGTAVPAEAGLSFLGVGVRPPTPSWGQMLNQSFSLIYEESPPCTSAKLGTCSVAYS
jgi:peptide/nickel transport system permease protein